MTRSLSAAGISVVLLDIEGTTTPVDFVYQVLFPFARAHVAEYLAREQDSDSRSQAISLLRDERAKDNDRAQNGGAPSSSFGGPRHSSSDLAASAGGEVSPADLVAYVHRLMDRDRKSPGLKMLQGLIWEAGYRSGELKGEVYADVPRALERWRAQRRNIYIYSSGSVLAQQLLFSTTRAGDLTKSLSGYFDTAVGPKTSPESYRIILARIDVPPAEVLFVSDVVAELDAAHDAEFQTALCVREAVPAPGRHPHPEIHTFDEIVD